MNISATNRLCIFCIYNILYIYIQKVQVYFWQKYSYVSQKIGTPTFGRILGFWNGKWHNSTLMNSFCGKIIPIKSKFRGLEPYQSQKIRLLQVRRFKKCEIAPLGGFWQKYAGIGDSKKCQNWVEMGLEWSIWGIKGTKMIVRAPRTVLDHSRPPKTKKNSKNRQNHPKLIKNRQKIPLSIPLLGGPYW